MDMCRQKRKFSRFELLFFVTIKSLLNLED